MMISTKIRGKSASHRGFICVVTVCFLLSCLGPGQLFAQEVESDFEAPIIEHEEVTTGKLGEVQSFSVSVVDNQELKNVQLFYRFDDQEEFQEIKMKPLAESAFFAARVETADIVAANIEYYFKAEDIAGNISLKGFTFDPLVRVLEASGKLTANSDTAVEPTIAETATKPDPNKSKTLYYVLGALAIGGLAALAASSSSGSDSTSSDECDPSGCRVTLTIPTP